MCCVGAKTLRALNLYKETLRLSTNLNGSLRATGCQLGHAPVMSMVLALSLPFHPGLIGERT